ncbi:MAG: phosphatidylglycerophosphatase A [Rhodobacteraceae bacterium]|nr:phosphatidylglycerophosphatase A [Paracoccaceae bacterium]
MSRFIATFFYVGLLPKAPGTWGSLAALPLGYALHYFGGFPALVAGVILSLIIGVWSITLATKDKADHDPSEIVIDEVCGQWIALLPLSAGLWYAGVDPQVFPYPGWIGAFLLFRLFDIWKPWLVGWADRKHTPLGVMLDDVIAGAFAAILVTAAAAFSHGVLM